MEGTKRTSGPDDSFYMTEDRFDPAALGRGESLFTLGNGSLGFRGDFEEGYPGAREGVYLNGFYDTAPIRYGETAYGYARNGQTMLNLANAKRIRIFLDGEELCLARGEVKNYRRVLSMKEGTLTREFEWRSPEGRAARVRFERMVSLSGGDVACLRCAVEPLEGVKQVRIESAIDARAKNTAAREDPRVGSCLDGAPLKTMQFRAQGDGCMLVQATRRSALAYACAAVHRVRSAAPVTAVCSQNAQEVCCTYCAGGAVLLEKFVAYTHGPAGQAAALGRRAQAQARQAAADAERLQTAQREALEEFWTNTGLSIEGDPRLLQGLRFSLFQVFQSAGRDGKTNISAKGLSGEGYEGHYFWDTETYIFPFFLYTLPGIARSLLCYRYSILNQARARAREMGHPRGALFPWRTINGEECSAYYPAGTAQYHINADIANAVALYAEATGDEAFMRECGVEILAETARLWLDLGFYSAEQGGRFCIDGVTGPDEYSVLVNNNCYTNLMAAENLEQAARWTAWLRETDPAAAGALFRRIGLGEGEPGAWRAAAQSMYLPYDEARGVYLQDDAFFQRVPWPLQTIPPENFPLLLHYHPLVIYRHQVCKQADLVLALLLRGERFDLLQKRRIFDVYEPLTTHDSSLSKTVFSIVASEIGYHEKAYAFFEGSARLDLDDSHGNSRDGLHMANMAGTWLSVVYGFAGMRQKGGLLAFHPCLPQGWQQYGFCIRWRGRRLRVRVGRAQAAYLLEEGEAMALLHQGARLWLEPGVERAADTAPRRFDGVVFDLDGVLCHTDRLHCEAWAHACAQRGIPFSEAVNEQLRGVSRSASVELILKSAAMELPQPGKDALAREKNARYRTLLEQLTPADVPRGTREMLKALRAQGVRLAVASASENAPMILRRVDLDGLLDAVVDGTMLRRSKPDPEVFLRAAELLGLEPRQCLVVEDAAAGAQAAAAGGFACAGLACAAQAREADYPLQDVTDLLPLFGSTAEAPATACGCPAAEE